MKWDEYRNAILAEIDNEAFYESELRNITRIGHELKAECPFKDLHEEGSDETPSFTVNLDKGVYYCHTCHSKGNVHTLFKTLYGLTNEEAWFELGDKLKIERPNSSKPARPEINRGLISSYHKELMKLEGPIREVIRDKRGLIKETLKRFQLGWDGERITIPVFDEYNLLVNFRRYKWNSNENKWKVLNYIDSFGNSYGEVRIFGIQNLINDNIEEVVWCEGEMDRLVAEQHGFPAVCPTSGAGTWRPAWTKYFRNKKRVYIVHDNDEAGRRATEKISEKLFRVTDVKIVKWPKDFPQKGDITDFFTSVGMNTTDFKRLLAEAEDYKTEEIVEHEEATEVHLAASSAAEYYGKRVKVPVMVSGKDSTPFVCPKLVKASCGDSADADSKKCAFCGLAAFAGEREIELSSKDKDVMKLIKCTEKQQESILKDILDINQRCKSIKIDIKEYMNIEELRLIPKAEANFGFSKDYEYVVRTGYCIGNNIKTNRRYTMYGYMYPEPSSQYAHYLFDKATPEKDLVTDFELSDEMFEQLKIFQVKDGQTIKDKFDEIHRDLERNITYIWERRDVAIAVDLIYHTVLNFYFQGQFVKRGWGELLIIGDSGQAKTTIVERLMSHYQLGELHSGESSRRTGLVYSIQQNNRRWFLVWGAFPLNDGGLVVIDELSGMNEDELAVMSDVRSSGIAKSTGVITAETTARTRAIYISNPRNGRPLNTETYGVNAVLRLFGKAEDVRRLDLAMAVASGDINPRLMNINLSDVDEIPHKYTSELCNLRVLWAWSRRPENVIFTEGTVEKILDSATFMGNKYTSKVPIVEAADQRLKIARLSIGCAAAVMSTIKGENLYVKPEHVDFVVNFMSKVYSTKSFGYDSLSEKEKINTDTSTDNIMLLREKFLILPLNDFNEMAQTLYDLPYFDRRTLEDYTGLHIDDLKLLLKFLTKNHLIERVKYDYKRLPLGTTFFESVLNNPVTKDERERIRKQHYNSEF